MKGAVQVLLSLLAVPPTTVLLDVDGTLVDSNDAHAHAWVSALAEAGQHVPFERVRRCIGMGADKLVPLVAGVNEDDPAGKQISDRRGEIFVREWLPRIEPQPDADRLLQALKERGFTLVAASSAKRAELTRLLEVAGARWASRRAHIQRRCGRVQTRSRYHRRRSVAWTSTIGRCIDGRRYAVRH